MFSFLPGCRVLQIERGGLGSVVVVADSRRGHARCPCCGATSRVVHSRYRRSSADLPALGHEVRVALLVRRLYCRQADCPKRTFAERFPGAVLPHARRPARTTDLVQKLQIARRDLALESAIAKLDKYHQPILDEFAYGAKDQAETSVIITFLRSKAA